MKTLHHGAPSPGIEIAAEALEALLGWLPLAALSVDSELRITAANQSAIVLFGYSEGELVRRRLSDLVPAGSREFHDRVATSYFDAPYLRHLGSGLRLRGTRKDGTEVPMDVTLAPVFTPGGMQALAMMMDVSGAPTEKRLQESYGADFLSAACHDMRTPLNSILGFSELLRGGGAGELSPKQARYVDNIVSASEQLQWLVGDVLDLHQAATGRVQVVWESVELAPLIDGVLDAMQPTAHAKGLKLTHFKLEGQRAVSDRRRLNQVLANVLDNAVKYTDAGAVSVFTRRLGGLIQITVSDTGPGIPSEDLPQLFDPFFQGSLALRHAKSGYGLGLALTKHLLEALRGEIFLDSVQGRGTTVRVVIPAA